MNQKLELNFLQEQLLKAIYNNTNLTLIKRLKENILELQVESEGEYIATVEEEFVIGTTDGEMILEVGDIIHRVFKGDCDE